jgi:hypothetical protein
MSDESVDELISQLERLRIQEETILRRLVAARARENRLREDTENGTFRVGSRVEITNHVCATFGRTVTINDRRARITKIMPTRIYFRTVNRNSNPTYGWL